MARTQLPHLLPCQQSHGACMNDLARQAFQALKPACIALSNVTLAPNYGTEDAPRTPPIIQLDDLLAASRKTSPILVPQSVGNYVFMPIKPLLVADAPEDVLERVFAVFAWLLQTEWFIDNEDMTAQLLMLHSTFLARAKTEELKLSIVKAIGVLFDHAGGSVQVLKARPTLAHLATSLLNDAGLVELQETSLMALQTLYRQIDPDTAASFLPGTVSRLSRILTKQGQKSRVLVAGITLLQLSITKSVAGGSYTGYRAGKWFDATAAQLHMALTPILAHLLETDREAVQEATCRLCTTLLQTQLNPVRFVEFLLQVQPEALGEGQHDATADIIHTYIDSIVRILQSADERKKCNMLKSMTCAFTKLHPASSALLSDKLLQEILEFVQFEVGFYLIKSADEHDPPMAPRIKHLTREAQDSLCALLHVLKPTFEIPLDTQEGFYIAQQLGQSTFSHALLHLSDQTELAQLSILRQARQDGPLFKAQLRHVLFPLLALKQPNRYVLDEVAMLCLYESTATMIVDQADYLVNSLSLAFATLDITPNTPRMLGLLCRLSPDMVNLVDDVVEAFFDVLDAYHGYQDIVTGIFEGLEGVVTAAAGQIAEPDHFAKAIGTDTKAPPAQEENDEATEPEVSPAYMVVLKICRKGQLFLSHEDPQIRISLLAMLEQGFAVLATNENLLLPFIHLVWPPLCHLLDDPQAYVVAAAYRLVTKCIMYSGAFMRRRITEDVLWRIQEVLTPPKDARGNLIHSKAFTMVTLMQSTTKPREAEDNIRAAVIGDARSKRGIQAPGQEVGLGPAGYRSWQGTARRKVAEGIEMTLATIVRDAGLQPAELAGVMGMVKTLSDRSELLQRIVAEQATTDA